MKYLLLFLLMSAQAMGTTLYQSDPLSVTCSKPTGTPYGTMTWYAVIVDGTGVVKATLVVGTTASSYTMSVPANSGVAYPFSVVVFAGSTASPTSANALLIRWISSYTGTGISKNGPYVGTQAQDGSGNIIPDITTGTPAAPTDYEQTITLNNSSTSLQAYQVTMTGSSGEVLANQNVYLQPNTSKLMSYRFAQPFTINAYQMTPNTQYDGSGNAIGTVWTKASSTPVQTIAANATLNPAQTTPNVAQTAENNTLSPSAMAASAQAQTLQGSDEITGAIKDMTDQDLTNGQKLDTANSLLSGIQNSITGTNTQLGSANGNLVSINSSIAAMSSKVDTVNTSLASVNGTAGATTNAVNAVGSKIDTTNAQLGTISTGVSSGNTALGSISGKIDTTNTGLNNVNSSLNGSNSLLTTISGKLDTIIGNMGGGTADSGASDYAGAGNADTTATGFVNTMMTRFTNVKTAVGNLWLSLGLANTPGTAPLQFTVPLPLGSFDLNFENVASNWIDAARRFELFVLSVLFTITSIKTARSAFI